MCGRKRDVEGTRNVSGILLEMSNRGGVVRGEDGRTVYRENCPVLLYFRLP